MMAPSNQRSAFLRVWMTAITTFTMCAAVMLWMHVHEPVHLLGSVTSTSISNSKNTSSVVRIGWYGWYDFSARPLSGLTIREAEHICTDNSGNLVWAYGAWNLLDANLTEMVLLQPPYAELIDVLLFPTANILINESSYALTFKSYTEVVLSMVRAVKAPILTIGLGNQIRFDDMQPADVVKQSAHQGDANFSAASAVQLHPDQVALLRQVESSGGFTTTRGNFTAAIMEAHGLAPPLPLGCPSLFINHNPQLGAVLQQKWRGILQLRDPNLRLAVTLPHVHGDRPYPADLVRLLVERVLKAFPNSVVVLQTLHDMHLLKVMQDEHGLNMQPDRVRHYYDVESWITGLKACCDLVWGFRIHGTMAAFAAEVPGFVVSQDFRIKELADAMAVPSVDILQAKLDPDTFDLFDFLAATDGMDGSRFDQRRRDVAQVYAREFARLHLPLHPGISSLAGSS